MIVSENDIRLSEDVLKEIFALFSSATRCAGCLARGDFIPLIKGYSLSMDGRIIGLSFSDGELIH